MALYLFRTIRSAARNLLAAFCLMTAAAATFADPVWIDVRTAEEYASDHITGDANIPLAELNAEQLATQYGKDADIRLYCRSGNRAGQAMEILQTAGFSQVSNVGGIGDVRDLRELPTGAASAASTNAGAASAANR
jgi:phage shock protein E